MSAFNISFLILLTIFIFSFFFFYFDFLTFVSFSFPVFFFPYFFFYLCYMSSFIYQSTFYNVCFCFMYLCVFSLLVESLIFYQNQLVTSLEKSAIIITNNREKRKTHKQNNNHFYLCLVLCFTFISRFFISTFQWFKLDHSQITTFAFSLVLFCCFFFTVSCIHFNVFYVLLLKLRFVVNNISSSIYLLIYL